LLVDGAPSWCWFLSSRYCLTSCPLSPLGLDDGVDELLAVVLVVGVGVGLAGADEGLGAPESPGDAAEEGDVGLEPVHPRVGPPAHVPVLDGELHQAHALPGVGLVVVELVGVGVGPGLGGVVLPGGPGGVVDALFPGVGGGRPGVEGEGGRFEALGAALQGESEGHDRAYFL